MSSGRDVETYHANGSGRTVGLITTSHCLPVTRCCGSSRKGAEVARGNQARHVIRDTNGTILEINSFGSGRYPPPSADQDCTAGLSS